MIPTEMMAGVANHLWQSTLFAGAAWLLALALRKNHARTRYWLWMAASVKFLIPFSVLIWMGSHLGWSTANAVTRQAEISVVMEQISQPFPAGATPAGMAPGLLARNGGLLPSVLPAIWICGFLVVAVCWLRRWRRVSAAVRAGSPVTLEAAVPVLSSPGLLEPGVFGIFRPVLLLPQGILDHLTRAHLEAIVAHELCHVRRRDNLAAAVHMGVEALFWFHPLVWWVGARLVEEREHACDEEVLRLGNEPEVYAESILKTCQFYLESPLACMSGISGSDLKHRIVRIMSQHLAKKLSLPRRVLLGVAGMAAVAGPIVFGLMNAPQNRAQAQTSAPATRPSFEVASIKLNKSGDGRVSLMNRPGGIRATNVTPKMLVKFAYNIKDGQLLGAPSWLDSDRYDIDAKTDDGHDDKLRQNPDEEMEQRRLMMQSLLADRFKVVLHHESKELPVYMLVVGKNGPKLQEAADKPEDVPPPPGPDGPPPGPQGPQRKRMVMMGRGELTMTGVPMNMFAGVLSDQIGRNVIDKTGLKGIYDFKLKWTPEEGQGQMFKGAGDGDKGSRDGAPTADATGPSIFAALQEQLGLKLESQKAPVDTIVIDHMEKPSEN